MAIIVPTLRRVDHLEAALSSLAQQTRLPAEVIVATHAWDLDSHAFLSQLPKTDLPIRTTQCAEPGVIANMQTALDTTTARVVALLDDDVTLGPRWVSDVMAYFQDPNVGAISGRDILQDDVNFRLSEPTSTKVGVFAWYGRFHGNHHRGGGEARPVDVLKGCNCAFDGGLLRHLGFDGSLRGKGAQVGWELSLAFDLQKAGKTLVYDPSIRVDHWIAPRHDEAEFNRLATDTVEFSHMLYNDFNIMRRKAPLHLRWGHTLLALLWGGKSTCGFIRSILLSIQGDSDAWSRFKRVWRAYKDAMTFVA